MKRGLAVFGILTILVTLIACSEKVLVKPTVSTVAYDFINKKIEARVGVYFYPAVATHSTEINPSSHHCSAWKFPLELGPAIKGTIMKIAEAVFTHAEQITQLPKGKHDFDGIFTINLVDFNADVVFYPSGLFSGQAGAFIELSLKVAILNRNVQQVWHTVVGYQGRRKNDASTSCSQGALAIAKAVEHCLRQISIRLIERLVKEPKVRESLRPTKKVSQK